MIKLFFKFAVIMFLACVVRGIFVDDYPIVTSYVAAIIILAVAYGINHFLLFWGSKEVFSRRFETSLIIFVADVVMTISMCLDPEVIINSAGPITGIIFMVACLIGVIVSFSYDDDTNFTLDKALTLITVATVSVFVV
jgi:hypothetical protein